MLRELESCCLFVCLLDDFYGPPLGAKLCGGLFALGHAWLEDEGLQGASIEEVLVRKALSSQVMAMGASHFHLLRSVARHDAGGAAELLEHGTCAKEAERKVWRAELVDQSQSRGCLGQLEKLISGYPLTLSPSVASLGVSVYAGVQPFGVTLPHPWPHPLPHPLPHTLSDVSSHISSDVSSHPLNPALFAWV